MTPMEEPRGLLRGCMLADSVPMHRTIRFATIGISVISHRFDEPYGSQPVRINRPSGSAIETR